VLGQRPGDHKKNEIRDIPKLLDLLHLEGCIVTLDAMGCQKAIAQKIQDRKADYLLALKGNQGSMHGGVKLWFEDIGCENSSCFQTVDGDKGRIETREYRIRDQTDWLIERHPDWAGLRSTGRVKSRREINGKTSGQTRCSHYTTLGRFGIFNHGSTAARGSLRRSLRISSKPVRNQDFA
jgi:predicted transposase YbfD/YdcC